MASGPPTPAPTAARLEVEVEFAGAVVMIACGDAEQVAVEVAVKVAVTVAVVVPMLVTDTVLPAAVAVFVAVTVVASFRLDIWSFRRTMLADATVKLDWAQAPWTQVQRVLLHGVMVLPPDGSTN